MITSDYHPAAIEQDAQRYWETYHTFEVKEDLNTEKFYCLAMLPYPSGQLHMGHIRNYTISDAIARYHHMLGKNVLQPLSWDAFGLPAENAAITNQLPPAQWTYHNIDEMRSQLTQLGYAIDWKRSFATCSPDYYRWEQWLFVRLYKKGLAYKKNAIVNWDPVDQTVLANEQVINGRGWRSGALVERKEISQWFLKITDYAEELLTGLDQLEGWPEQVRTMQRNWIGKSQGIELSFQIHDQPNQSLTVFTTRPDTLFGVSYLAIAPEHALAHQAAKENQDIALFIAQCKHTKVAEADLAITEKRGIATPFYALHPITDEKLPIWIANFVLSEYGSGAVMAVPAHDARDWEFSKKYHIPLRPVLKPADGSYWNYDHSAYTESGILINSEQFSGLSSNEAINTLTEKLTANNVARCVTHYRLRDWGVSRQRYWGTPIPIIYCSTCGTVPVPEHDLPVILPEDVVPQGTGSPLCSLESFCNTTCPQCGEAAQRETDTFDTFVESSWYYARYCSYNQHQAILDDRAQYWTPVDQYVGGIEHAIMHLLYARFVHKLLRDEKILNSDEPFTRLLTQGMVLKDGAKMSKSKGNVVSPDEFIKKYGADTVRLFILFAAPPEQSLEWSDSGIEGAHRFLRRVYLFAEQIKPMLRLLHPKENRIDTSSLTAAQCTARKQMHSILKQANQDMGRIQLNTVVSASMKLFKSINELDTQDRATTLLLHEGMSILLRLLSPIAPHLCHYLWRELNFGSDIAKAPWPKVDNRALKTDMLTMVVQINGKRRAEIVVPINADPTTIQEIALANSQIQKFMRQQPHKKIIIVPNKLVNIVL